MSLSEEDLQAVQPDVHRICLDAYRESFERASGKMLIDTGRDYAAMLGACAVIEDLDEDPTGEEPMQWARGTFGLWLQEREYRELQDSSHEFGRHDGMQIIRDAGANLWTRRAEQWSKATEGVMHILETRRSDRESFDLQRSRIKLGFQTAETVSGVRASLIPTFKPVFLAAHHWAYHFFRSSRDTGISCIPENNL